MKLYKFRALTNEQDLERLKGILETGKFWCSTFSELNDPMEGVYHFLDYTQEESELVDLIYKTKQSYKICSFSAEGAFSDPLMWGYYANGFRGVAIEIEINSDEVNEINYMKKIPSFAGLNPQEEAKKILTTKLSPWTHECEFRFLRQSKENKIKIGTITALYYGEPYGNTDNVRDIVENSHILREYQEIKKEILKFSNKFNVRPVKIEKCKVIKK
ncbi:MAG: hypothetical protein JW976_06255 [Syntrophaceae bacterium]|nr:hypothetical protein [Syntrophaceae bacterium]